MYRYSGEKQILKKKYSEKNTVEKSSEKIYAEKIIQRLLEKIEIVEDKYRDSRKKTVKKQKAKNNEKKIVE